MQNNLREKIRIGELLVENNILTAAQLDAAIKNQKESGQKLGDCLIRMGLVTEPEFLSFLSKQMNIPFIDLRKHKFDIKLIQQLPESYARQFRAIILERYQDGYLIGMDDPLDIHAVDEVTRTLRKSVYLALVRASELSRMLDLHYRRTGEITHLAEQLQEQLTGDQIELSELKIEEGSVDAPVIQLIQSMFEDAVQVNASDIHIEPGEEKLSIRQRVDGVLQEQVVKEKGIAQALALRLKLMAGLNISEKRVPQDGRFSIKLRKKELDVRLSTLPTQYGESVVMRLLDQSGGLLNIDKTGMPEAMKKRFRQLVQLPHGLILVTGPTGSGKSTTLYAALNEINSPEKKIITVEDPVEYRLPGINQVQVNPIVDLTFSRVLRTTLRQDPDVILVGEMRDQETAEIAVRAALTGHLVLSTLHTNDAASSAMRLVDMGTAGYLVAATLCGVVAQRLVRKICESCRVNYKLTEQEEIWIEYINPDKKKKLSFYQGEGCTYCNGTGYQGRVGVFELLELNSEMMRCLSQNDPSSFTELAEESMRGKLLVDNSLQMALEGVTTVNEVIRIIGFR